MESQLKFRELDSKLKGLVVSERKVTAEIVSVIAQVDRQRLFLEMGYSSLFSYLTKEIGYSASAAQRRIEAARMLRQIPEIGDKLKTGKVNLSTISLVAQGVREKLKTSGVKSELEVEIKNDLFNMIENKNVRETQLIVAKELNIPVLIVEKSKVQQDESLRIELTLNRVQRGKLEKIKQLTSHTKPNANWSELIELISDFYLSKKVDSARERVEAVSNGTSETEVKVRQGMAASARGKVAGCHRYIPRALRRKIFERDQSCQWKARDTNRICGSQHQLEIHHQQPVWAGGNSSEENLQVLCRSHNLQIYRREAGIQSLD